MPGTRLLKRSFTLNGARTSIALEREFWLALQQIAQKKGSSLPRLLAELHTDHAASLASTLRVFALTERQRESRSALVEAAELDSGAQLS